MKAPPCRSPWAGMLRQDNDPDGARASFEAAPADKPPQRVPVRSRLRQPGPGMCRRGPGLPGPGRRAPRRRASLLDRMGEGRRHAGRKGAASGAFAHGAQGPQARRRAGHASRSGPWGGQAGRGERRAAVGLGSPAADVLLGHARPYACGHRTAVRLRLVSQAGVRSGSGLRPAGSLTCSRLACRAGAGLR